MPSLHPITPDISALVKAARTVVFTARRQGQDQLKLLSVRSIIEQVGIDFSLDEGVLKNEEIRSTLRNAVNAAVLEELPVDIPPAKRKRSSEDVNGSDNSMPPRAKRSAPVCKSENERRATSKGVDSRKSRLPKSKRIIESDVDATDDVTAPDRAASTSARSLDVEVNKPTQEPSTFKTHPKVDVEKSESELSVLIDESPKKKRTKKKTKGEDGGKPAKQKEPPATLNKDAETIKRLKSFVSACGARKNWAKEFADLPQPKQQIKRIKDILAELGMTVRYSMEKAKAIKKKRDLARELNDVLEFERKAGVSRDRRQSQQTKRVIGELDTDTEVEESSEDDEKESPVMKRKKSTASRSIMAYLADQSSDED